MNIKYLSTAFLTLVTLILVACESADRSGVTLTQKPSEPGIQPPPTTTNEPVSIISATAKCLAVYEPDFHSFNNGSKVQTVDCVAGSIYQNWHLTQHREILSDNGQCLEPAGEPESGALVVLNDCDGSAYQKWVVDEHTSSIHHGYEFSLCLEMPKLTIQFNGSPLFLMSCHGEGNQQWVAQALRFKRLTSALNEELSISIVPSAAEGPPILATSRNVHDWHSAAWTLEPVGNFYRIRNSWKPDRLLHIENGFLEASTISPYWESAMWAFIRQNDRQGEAYLLRNVGLNNIYIGLDANYELKAGTFTEVVDGSTLWRILDIDEGTSDFSSPT